MRDEEETPELLWTTERDSSRAAKERAKQATMPEFGCGRTDLNSPERGRGGTGSMKKIRRPASSAVTEVAGGRHGGANAGEVELDDERRLRMTCGGTWLEESSGEAMILQRQREGSAAALAAAG